MTHLVEVAFRGNRKEFFQWGAETAPALKSGVIVEADRGEDLGYVHSTGELAEVRCRGCAHGCGTTPPPRAVVRLATDEDIALDRTLTEENESARQRAMERVRANGLVMKLTDAEWQFDRRKLTFYFTAERRVDFRALVRDLASMFRARIELKQIGVRDEAKRLSGIGRCGREYCSSSWLPDLRPVNLGVAKDQKLSLNPQQISGACGRLMCCLRYEHEFYVQSRRRFPKEGRILTTSVGEEKVIACDIFNDRVTLRSAEGDTRVVPLAELREEIGGFGEAVAAGATTRAVSEDGITARASSSERRTRGADGHGVRTHTRSAPQNAPSDVDELIDDVDDVVVSDVRASGTPVVPDDIAIIDVAVTSVAVVEDDNTDVDSADADSADADGADADGADAGDADDGGDGADVTGTDATGTEPRRKRRRGRRGGRRLRAAEQRRQALEADNARTSEPDPDPDPDAPAGPSADSPAST